MTYPHYKKPGRSSLVRGLGQGRVPWRRGRRPGVNPSKGEYLATRVQFSVAGRGEAFRALMLGDAYRRQLHPHSLNLSRLLPGMRLAVPARQTGTATKPGCSAGTLISVTQLIEVIGKACQIRVRLEMTGLPFFMRFVLSLFGRLR